MNIFRRSLSLLLVLVLCLSLFPTGTLALDLDGAAAVTAEADPPAAAPAAEASTDVAVDETNFPDAIFRSYVRNFDTDDDGCLSAEEIAAVTEIDCSGSDIASLDGIEFFKNLEILWCYNNALFELDLTLNTALTELYCYNNGLTQLDLRNNPLLFALKCFGNNLGELDLSMLPDLLYLDCSSNELSALDVSANTALTYLACYDNGLFELDLSMNTALKDLDCSGNFLAELDLSANTALENLDCSGQVKPVAVSSLQFDMSQLVDDISKVSIDSDSYDAETGIMDLAAKPASFAYSYATGQGGMDVTVSLQYPATAINETNFPDANFRSYVSEEFDTDSSGSLSDAEIAAVTEIWCSSSGIASMQGVEYFTALEELHCDYNSLTSLDVSANTALSVLWCCGNPLTELDVSKNTALTELYCGESSLTELDLSKNTALEYLSCSDSQVASLNVNGCSALESLVCEGCQLTQLDVSGCSALNYLICSNNRLTELDLSANTALENLTCGGQAAALTVDGSSCQVAMSKLAKDISKISIESENYDADQGLLTLSDRPSAFVYNYATGFGSTAMDVTVAVSYEESSDGGDNEGDEAVTEIRINAGYFPDANFRSYVRNFDTDDDGCLSAEEIAAVTEIRCSQMEIADLSGVEFFTALTVLDCSLNALTSLDLSANTALEQLYCYENSLTELDLSSNTALTYVDCSYNCIPELDLSANTALEYLYCYGNELTELDVSANTALTKLYCYNNALTALDVSANTALAELICSNNSLTELDLSKNTALTELHCSLNELTSLSVSASTALIYLDCGSNDLSVLDVSSNTALTILDCGGNQLAELELSVNTALEELHCRSNSLTTIDLSTNTALELLDCAFNNFSALDISKNPSLNYLNCANNDIASLDLRGNGLLLQSVQAGDVSYAGTSNNVIQYTLSGTGAVILDVGVSLITDDTAGGDEGTEGPAVDENGNILINATNFPDVSFLTYVIANLDSDGDETLSAAEIAGITTIRCGNMGISDLSGVEFFTELTNLYCYNNGLTELDLSANTKLEWLNANGNQLTKLTLGTQASLETLMIGDNQLETLDVSGCSALTWLDCDDNALTALDVSGCTALEDLSCMNNDLATLTLGELESLGSLWASGNQLTTLTLSGCPALVNLSCKNNALTALDISSNTAIKEFFCGGNQLTELDVSGCKNLRLLSCGSNRLTELDLSANSSLTALSCEDNALTALDLSGKPDLFMLNCSGNSITELDLSSHSAMQELYCQNNQLTSLKVSSAELFRLECYNNPLTILNLQGCECLVDLVSDSEYYGVEYGIATYGNGAYEADEGVTEYETVLRVDETVNLITTGGGSSGDGGGSSGDGGESGEDGGEDTNEIIAVESFPIDVEIAEGGQRKTYSFVAGTTGCHWFESSGDYDTYGYLYDADMNLIAENDDGSGNGFNFGLGAALTAGETYYLTVRLWSSDATGSFSVEATAECHYVDGVCSICGVGGDEGGDGIAIDESNFPDANFRIYVSENFDTNGSNTLSAAEIAEATEIYCSGCEIADLTGIEYFTSLQYLYCYENELTELDLNANTALEYLDCSWNELTSLDISGCTRLMTLNCEINALTALDVSSNTALTQLDCGENSLTELDMSDCPALERLICDYNDLETLDLSGCANLSYIFCPDNELTELDVSDCTALEILSCSYNALTELDLSANTALENLTCSFNPLTALTLDSCTALDSLNCESTDLTELDLSKNTALKTLSCASCELTALNVGANTALTWLNCSGNDIAALDLSGNTALTYVNCSNNCIPELDVSALESLGTLYCYGQKISYSFESAPENGSYSLAMSELVTDTGKVSMEADSYDAETAVLSLADKPESFTYTYDTGSTAMDVTVTVSYVGSSDDGDEGGDGIAIDEGNFPDANFRSYVSENFDTDGSGTLSAPEIAAVTRIFCTNESISDLTGVEHFTALTSLFCDDNGLTALDVSANTQLQTLGCRNNAITSLTFGSGNTVLSYVDCGANKLAVLDPSCLTGLEHLWCEGNELTTLDLSANTALESLYCYENKLTELDLSANTALEQLDCSGQTVSYGFKQAPESGSYSLAMSELVKDTGKVRMETENYDAETAVLSLADKPESFTYTYDTGSTAMDVTVTVSYVGSSDDGDEGVDGIAIDESNFPDANFRSYVSENFDTDGSGTLSAPEIAAVTEIDCSWDGIADLSGVEFFVALEVLNCASNDLTELDLSANTALVELNCQQNELTELDLSNNTALVILDADWNNLTELDLSNNTALESLSCYDNNLTELNISANTALTYVYVVSNESLTELDVSACTALEDLRCDTTAVAELDLSANTALERLSCANTSLAELDLSNNAALTYLDCTYNYDLLELDLRNCPLLVTAVSEGDRIDWNESEIVYGYGLLNPEDPEPVYWITLRVSPSLTLITGDEGGDGGDEGGDGIAIDESNFPDANFRSYVSENFDTNGSNTLSAAEIANITIIECGELGISDLSGIEHFTALTYLHCGNNEITALDVSANTELTDLICFGNRLTELDVSANTALEYLDCDENELTELDISGLSALESLYCMHNHLAELDLEGLEKLSTLNIGSQSIGYTFTQIDETGAYPLDMSQLVSQPALVSTDGWPVYDAAAGIMDLSDIPLNFTYWYDTGITDETGEACTMDVSVELEYPESGLPAKVLTFVDITANDQTKSVTFTPESTGCYSFESFGIHDTFAEIYDPEWNSIASDNDAGMDRNFCLDVHLQAGQTYTLVFSRLDYDSTGRFTVTWEQVGRMGDWEEVQSPSYTEEGLEQRFCSYCGSDESNSIDKLILGVPSITGSLVASSGKPRLTWDAVDGATSYEVWRAYSADGTYYKMGSTTGTGYTNTGATAGTTYYYKVRAVAPDGSYSDYSNIVYRTCDYAQPVVTASNVAASGKIKLSWSAVDGATNYYVYRSTSASGTYSYLGSTSGTSYVNTGAVAGTTYYYKVKAVGSVDAAASALSSYVYRTCDYAQPVVTASNVAASGKIRLSWSAVSGATKYYVYRATSSTGTYSYLGSTTGTTYVNTGAVAGTTYYYKVKALGSVDAATSALSSYVSRTCDYAQPVVSISCVAASGKPRLTWTAVDGATSYEVWRAYSADGTYYKMGTTTSTSYTNTGAEANTTYYYKVYAVGSSSYAKSAASAVKNMTCDCAQPVASVGCLTVSGKPQLTWNAVSGAVKYEVWRAYSANGTYYKMGETTRTNYTNTSAVAGTTYYYKVRAIGSSSYATSAYSTVVSKCCVYAQPDVSVTRRASDGKPVISWNAVSGAAKYIVYMSPDPDDYPWRRYTTTSNTSIVHTAAVAGNKYYYKVVAANQDLSVLSAASFMESGFCTCAQPVITKITRSLLGKPKLTWNAVDGAVEYEVWRAYSANGTYYKMGSTTGTTYTNTSAKAGTTYYYMVKAIGTSASLDSAFSSVVSVKAGN